MRSLSALLLVLLTPAAAYAQDPAPTPGAAHAVRVADRAPVLDGRLDDPVWATAPPATDFTQRQPEEGLPATDRTEVRFVYDGEALYVGARMFARDPGAIRAPVSRRDAGDEADRLLVSLDTYRDRRTAYTFGVTASGVRLDRYHASDVEEGDATFDPVWAAATRVDSLGWTAELRIPFSQLRFNAAGDQAWGLNLSRYTPAANEEAFWVLVPRDVAAWASRFGTLEGIDGVRPARRIELRPYVAADATLDGREAPGDPFYRAQEGAVRVGGDLKVGVGPSLTLDATINPDFGQVELDPAQVNLSAFEIVLPERRPFFTEGLDLLSGGGTTYFYSRRIGAAPHGQAPGDFSDRPDFTPILGAAKLTGRLAPGTSVGALAAVTGRGRARSFDAETGAFETVDVEPPTAFGVARVQRQFGPDESTAGLILTGVQRSFAADSPLAALLPSRALAGGGDVEWRLGGGAYTLGAYAGGSYVTGDSLALVRLQRSSVRYYQRPDAPYVRVDSSRHALSGYAAGVSAARVSGAHWLWSTSLDLRSPGFEINDAGRIGSGDEVYAAGALRYRETRPGPLFRAYSVRATTDHLWNYGGVWNYASVGADASLTWRNYWVSTLTAFVELPALSDDLARGGPLVGTGPVWAFTSRLASASTARTRWNARVYYGQNEYADPTYRFSGGVAVRLSPRWQLSVDPNYVRFGIARQFVGARSGGPEATYGQRYVFARLDFRELRLPFRASVSLTPNLSLEAFAEPYIAAGRHADFGELAAAGSREIRRYGEDGSAITLQSDGSYVVTDGAASFTLPNLDFYVRSVRSSAVLRWEWRPGSTFFLVWQQDREAFDERFTPIGAGAVADALGAAGRHVFAFKYTHWLGY